MHVVTSHVLLIFCLVSYTTKIILLVLGVPATEAVVVSCLSLISFFAFKTDLLLI